MYRAIIPRASIIIPKESIANPIKDPNPPKGTPLIMKITVKGIKESKETIPMRVHTNERIDNGFTEKAKIPFAPVDRTEKKLVSSHLDFPANRSGRSIVTELVL